MPRWPWNRTAKKKPARKPSRWDRGRMTGAFRPFLERLEDRTVPAALTVTHLAPSYTEGQLTVAPVLSFTDTNTAATKDDFTATINWGDNTSSPGSFTTGVAANGGTLFNLLGSHLYAEEGTYLLHYTITGKDGTTLDGGVVTAVRDAPLTLTPASLTPVEGQALNNVQVATFTDADFFATSGDYTAVVQWGDGEQSPGTVAWQNGTAIFSVTATKPHPYSHGGNYSVSVTVTDTDATTSVGSTWVTASTPVGPRADGAEVTGRDGHIYVIGGFDGTNYLATTWAYDPQAGSWTQLRDMPSPRGSFAAAAGPDGRIYVIAGYANVVTRTVYAFTPPTTPGDLGTWDQVASLPSPLPIYAGAAATGPDGRIYVFGGSDGDQFLKSVYAYTPGANTWVQVADMPVAMFASAAAVGADGRIYLFGGRYSPSPGNNTGTLNQAFAYTPGDPGSWQTLPLTNMPPLRSDAVVTGADGRIYVIGGYDGNSVQGTVWAYTPGATALTPAAPLPAPLSLAPLATSGADGKLYVVGGYNAQGVPQSTMDTIQLGVPRAGATAAIQTVVAPDHAPTAIALSSTAVAEGNAVGTPVGLLSATDPDPGDTSFTFSLVSGAGSDDNGSFFLDGNVLRTNAVFNFAAQSSYAIRVRATDAAGLGFEEPFTITVAGMAATSNPVTITQLNAAAGLLTSSTTFVALPGLTTTFTLASDETIRLRAVVNVRNASGSITSAIAQLTVDGVTAQQRFAALPPFTQQAVPLDCAVSLAAGTHTISVVWRSGSGAVLTTVAGSFLTVSRYNPQPGDGSPVVVQQALAAANVQTSSSTFVLVPGLSTTLTLSAAQWVDVSAILAVVNSASATTAVSVALSVDGSAADPLASVAMSNAQPTLNVPTRRLLFLPAGTHSFSILWASTAGTAISTPDPSSSRSALVVAAYGPFLDGSPSAFATTAVASPTVAQSSGYLSVPGLTQTITLASTEAVDVSALLDVQNGSSASASVDAALILDGVTIQEQFAALEAGASQMEILLHDLVNLVPGTHTFSVLLRSETGAPVTVSARSSLSATTFNPIPDFAPVVSAATISPVEGQQFSGLVATFTDPDTTTAVGDYTATIDWGDGETAAGTIQASPDGSFSVLGQKPSPYAEEGSYTFQVTVDDAGGASAAVASAITVADAPLTVTPVPFTPVEGRGLLHVRVATFTDADPNGTATDFFPTIDWGDGDQSSGSVVPNGQGGWDVYGTTHFAYGEDGNYTVQVTVFDTGGGTATSSATVAVADAPLAATLALQPVEGQPVGLVATFTDPYPGALTDYTAGIDFGDGTTAYGVIGYDNVNHVFTVSAPDAGHAYAEEGVYHVEVQVNDVGGASVTVNGSVPVADAPLTATGATFVAGAGQPFTGVVASFTDAGSDGTPADYAATIDWGDGNSCAGTVTANTSGGFDISGTNTYAASGTYAVHVSITDVGGSSTAADGTARVSAAATHFVVSAPATSVAGNSFSVTVTAADGAGNAAFGYAGTVAFSSQDPLADLPDDYAFTAADAGVHTFTVALKKAGSQDVTVLDRDTLTGTTSVTVTPASVPSLDIQAPDAATAGTPFSFTVTAYDSYGNLVTGYTGTVHFTSTDGQAGVPADYTFVSADHGVHTFSATLKTAGDQSVTVADTSQTGRSAWAGVSVSPAAVGRLALTATGDGIAGDPTDLQLTAYDPYNNVTTDTRGITVTFSSTDPQALLPGIYGFPVADGGTARFSAILFTAGSRTITATDSLGRTSTAALNVSPAAASSLTLTAPANATAGTAFTATVRAYDPYGNLATGYAGTVSFGTTDSGAVTLPRDYTFTAADAGVHTFAATLVSAGTQALTVNDQLGLQNQASVQVAAAAAFRVVIGAPDEVTAGVAFSITVTALDAYGNNATSYRGRVHVTSLDAQAVLPADYTFTAADAGVHTFTGVKLKTAGSQVMAVGQVGAGIGGGTTGVLVDPAAASRLVVLGFPYPIAAGSAGTFTVRALDPFNNVATGYTGTVHFTSTDAKAALPADYTFTAADAGVQTFAATFKTAATQTLTATDTATGTIKGSQAGIIVTPAAAAAFTVAGYPSPTVAGDAHGFTVTAKDAYGNVATGYAGTVHFTSTDSQAVLPADYTFTAADAGKHTFASTTFKTAGSQSLTATDASASIAASQAVTVTPAAAFSLQLAGFPSPTTAGIAQKFTVTAYDRYGNRATGYRGQVHLTGSDAQAVLPGNYAFTAADAGSHTFTATLKTAGSQSVSAQDTANGSLAATQPNIAVTPAAAASFQVFGFPSSVVAGASATVTVEAFDAYGNVATGYAGSVKFTSTDTKAVLPANYAFTAADAGVHTFAVTLKTASAGQSVTVTDTAKATVTGKQAGIQVTPAALAGFAVTGFASPTAAGTARTVTVTARDVYGNTVTGYTGTVHFTSSDAKAVLPADYAFTAADGGVHTFSVTLLTAGVQNITAADGTFTGQQANIQITPAAASHLVITGLPASVAAGTAVTITVAAYDAYGNVATGYRGTVGFTSTDPAAVLPANYTYTATAAGVHTFRVTFKTRGTQTLTVTDLSSSTIFGQQSLAVT